MPIVCYMHVFAYIYIVCTFKYGMRQIFDWVNEEAGLSDMAVIRCHDLNQQ